MTIKASDHIKFYHNPNGPTITTVARFVIEADVCRDAAGSCRELNFGLSC